MYALSLKDLDDQDGYSKLVAAKTTSTYHKRKTMLKINEVNFSFANRSLIGLLTKRGNALKMAYFDKAD
jgi:hypothetical protein